MVEEGCWGKEHRREGREMRWGRMLDRCVSFTKSFLLDERVSSGFKEGGAGSFASRIMELLTEMSGFEALEGMFEC